MNRMSSASTWGSIDFWPIGVLDPKRRLLGRFPTVMRVYRGATFVAMKP